MAKHHISKDGKVRPCRATKKKCALVHGDTKEEAMKIANTVNESEFGVLLKASKGTKLSKEQLANKWGPKFEVITNAPQASNRVKTTIAKAISQGKFAAFQ